MIGRLLYDSQGEIACALEVLRSLAADMDGCMKDELADELSTNYLAPKRIWRLCYQVMQALSHHMCLGMCKHSCRHCRCHWFEEAGESWAAVGEVSRVT